MRIGGAEWVWKVVVVYGGVEDGHPPAHRGHQQLDGDPGVDLERRHLAPEVPGHHDGEQRGGDGADAGVRQHHAQLLARDLLA